MGGTGARCCGTAPIATAGANETSRGLQRKSAALLEFPHMIHGQLEYIGLLQARYMLALLLQALDHQILEIVQALVDARPSLALEQRLHHLAVLIRLGHLHDHVVSRSTFTICAHGCDLFFLFFIFWIFLILVFGFYSDARASRLAFRSTGGTFMK